MEIQSVSETIQEICQQFVINDEKMKQLMDLVLNEVKKGLSKDKNKDSDIKCYVTYVCNLPSGNERGKYLALDLGGTNLRVLMIHLTNENDFNVKSKMYPLTRDIMLGTGEQLFDYVAECLANFMFKHNVASERLSLGFSFSFAVEQLGLAKGLLVRWGKGFKCSGVVGNDVVQLLSDAINRRGDIQIDVYAILNDATGTLMSCAWENHNCRIALIIGTGTNVCYVERTENVETYDGSDANEPHIIINTEWSALGDSGGLDFIRTEYDKDVDAHSLHPGDDIFEKMISGMYMGELVRLIVCQFTREGLLFNGIDSEMLRTPGQFFTKYLSEIEADQRGTYTNCLEVLQELGLENVTEQDCANVRYICECISHRSARLVAAGIAALINKIDIPSVTVGVDGSVYRYHPNYHDLLTTHIRQFVKSGISFELKLAEDGSGCGAALVACMSHRND